MMWKPFPWDECPDCGAEAEVFTDHESGVVGMDENARCRDCGKSGLTNFFEDDAWVDWDEE